MIINHKGHMGAIDHGFDDHVEDNDDVDEWAMIEKRGKIQFMQTV